MSLRNRVFAKLRDRLADDRLSLRIILWDGATFDFVPAPRVTIALRSRRLLRYFLTGDIARLGRAYVEGEIDVEGRLQDVLQTRHPAGQTPRPIGEAAPSVPPTLLHWARRLEAQREKAIKTAGARRYRIWRMYMAAMAYAFDRGWLSVCQVVAQKGLEGGMAPRPWTRQYQYVPASPVNLSKCLDWGDL